MITSIETERKMFNSIKMIKWIVQWDNNNEGFEFLTTAQLRMIQLESLGFTPIISHV